MPSSSSGIQVILDTDNSLLWESQMCLFRGAHPYASRNEKKYELTHKSNINLEACMAPISSPFLCFFPAVSCAAIEGRIWMVTRLLRIVQFADSNFCSDVSSFSNSLETSAHYKFNDRYLAFPRQFTYVIIFCAIKPILLEKRLLTKEWKKDARNKSVYTSRLVLETLINKSGLG
jgi:hypothetical protein